MLGVVISAISDLALALTVALATALGAGAGGVMLRAGLIGHGGAALDGHRGVGYERRSKSFQSFSRPVARASSVA